MSILSPQKLSYRRLICLFGVSLCLCAVSLLQTVATIWLGYGALALCLFALIVTDVRTFTLPLGPLVCAYALSIWLSPLSPNHMLLNGALLCALMGVVKGVFETLYAKPVVGWGDVGFLPLAGLWVPLKACPLFLITLGVLSLGLACVWRALESPYFPLGAAIGVCLLVWILNGAIVMV